MISDILIFALIAVKVKVSVGQVIGFCHLILVCCAISKSPCFHFPPEKKCLRADYYISEQTVTRWTAICIPESQIKHNLI